MAADRDKKRGEEQQKNTCDFEHKPPAVDIILNSTSSLKG